MPTRAGEGLARVTVAGPSRRADVALPEDAAVAELLPTLLRVCGEDLADEGQRHGGWALRRADGTPVDLTRSLTTQEVRDGEVMHLVPRRLEWPEVDYDDVVDGIASGARLQSRPWWPGATRRAGVTTAGLLLVSALPLVLVSGPSWRGPGAVALGLAVVLLAAAVLLARAVGDTATAVPLALVAVGYGFVGGLLVLLGDRPLGAAGWAQVLLGSAVALVLSLLAYVGVGDRTQYLVTALVGSLLGMVGAGLGSLSYLEPADVGALLLGLVTALVPAYPLLSIRLGKLPMPKLPTSTDELLADPPLVPPTRVRSSVRRSDELLTGLLGGSALVSAVSFVLVAARGGVGPTVLVAVVGLLSVLRSRLFPTVRHRVPLLVTALSAVLVLVVTGLAMGPDLRLYAAVPALAVLALAVVAATTYYQRTRPTPYLGRIADILDVLLAVAVVPLVCLVIGLYGYVRGLFG